MNLLKILKNPEDAERREREKQRAEYLIHLAEQVSAEARRQKQQKHFWSWDND